MRAAVRWSVSLPDGRSAGTEARIVQLGIEAMMTEPHHSNYQSRRLVFRKPRAENDAQQVATLFGWTRSTERPFGNYNNPYRRVIWEVVSGLTVTYYEDPLPGASCLVVRSVGNQSEVAEIVGILAVYLNFLDDVSLLQAIDSGWSKKEKSEAIVRAGFGAPREFDKRFFDKLSEIAEEPVKEFREAVIWAIAYTEWPQFRPVLRKLTHDPKISVKNLAKHVIEIFERIEKKKS